MDKEQIIALLNFKSIKLDSEGRTVGQRIYDCDPDVLKDAVVDFIYGRLDQ